MKDKKMVKSTILHLRTFNKNENSYQSTKLQENFV